jgi:hypothetical protein
MFVGVARHASGIFLSRPQGRKTFGRGAIIFIDESLPVGRLRFSGIAADMKSASRP